MIYMTLTSVCKITMIVNSFYLLLLSCFFLSLGNNLRLVDSALSDRDVIKSPDYNVITAQKMFRTKLSKTWAYLQVSSREGWSYKTWCICLLMVSEQCAITPVRRNMGAIYHRHSLQNSQTSKRFYFVSQKWVTIGITWPAWRCLAYIWVLCLSTMDAKICLCMLQYSCIHSCCLCVLL